jgi:rRNA-processing protein FCF1
LKLKIDLRERIRTSLQSNEIRFYVTRSVLNELRLVGEKALSALEFATNCCTVIEDTEQNGESPSEKLMKFLGLNNF